jgi:hypothetical protein
MLRKVLPVLLQAHFHSGKFSAEGKNFQLLIMIFSENFLSVEIFFSGNGPQEMGHKLLMD